jgi:hypothetical protein
MIFASVESCWDSEQERAKVLLVLVAVNWKCSLSKSSFVNSALQLISDSHSSANVGGWLITVATAAMNDIAAAVPMVGSLREMYAVQALNVDRDPVEDV